MNIDGIKGVMIIIVAILLAIISIYLGRYEIIYFFMLFYFVAFVLSKFKRTE